MDLLLPFQDNQLDPGDEDIEILLLAGAAPVREGRTIWLRRNLFVEFSDPEFRRAFRMTKTSFLEFFELFQDTIEHNTDANQTNRGLPLPAIDQMLLAINYLATGLLLISLLI